MAAVPRIMSHFVNTYVADDDDEGNCDMSLSAHVECFSAIPSCALPELLETLLISHVAIAVLSWFAPRAKSRRLTNMLLLVESTSDLKLPTEKWTSSVP